VRDSDHIDSSGVLAEKRDLVTGMVIAFICLEVGGTNAMNAGVPSVVKTTLELGEPGRKRLDRMTLTGRLKWNRAGVAPAANRPTDGTRCCGHGEPYSIHRMADMGSDSGRHRTYCPDRVPRYPCRIERFSILP
jgi:hypothetical protein